MRGATKPVIESKQVHFAVDQQTGTVLAVFAGTVDVDAFAKAFPPGEVMRFSRTLFYGQPPHRGFNR